MQFSLYQRSQPKYTLCGRVNKLQSILSAWQARYFCRRKAALLDAFLIESRGRAYWDIQTMSYAQRVLLAACCSVMLHGVLLVAWPPRADSAFKPQARPAPIVLNLQPEPERRLINAHTPAERSPGPTDLVASMDSEAMDTALRDGDVLGPHFDTVDAFDDLALAESRLVEQLSSPPAPVPNQEDSETPSPQESLDAPARLESPEADTRLPEPDTRNPIPDTRNVLPSAPEASPAESLGRFDVAKAGGPPAPEPSPRVTKGRLRDAVKKEGPASFEAHHEQFAPYMHEVRRRVEREWNAALMMRYAGTSPTEAVVDCAIAPDGTLVRVEVIGEPEERVYAALCKDAVEKAGPFRPFPFAVPDAYRSKNLEIRWTFSFL